MASDPLSSRSARRELTRAAMEKGPHRRGRPRPADVQRPDHPFTLKLSDGRTIYVEVPGRFTVDERSGVGFTPEGIAFLDRIRSLAMAMDRPPSPAYITTLREALGMTQQDLGERIGVNKLTVSRWERGTLRPSSASVE